MNILGGAITVKYFHTEYGIAEVHERVTQYAAKRNAAKTKKTRQKYDRLIDEGMVQAGNMVAESEALYAKGTELAKRQRNADQYLLLLEKFVTVISNSRITAVTWLRNSFVSSNEGEGFCPHLHIGT